MLTCQEITLGYERQEKALVSGLTLDFQPGHLVCLMGPNGVGKSTFLRVLGGMQSPLSGNVYVGQEGLEALSPQQRARQLSMVFTSAFSPGPISVYALVSMGRYPYADWLGRLAKEDHEHIHQALVMVDIMHLAERKVQELSDGERQKVMIARALAQDTPYLLLDEPTAHLDLSNRLEIFRQLQKLSREQGKGIILATHQLDQALQVADRMCLLTAVGSYHWGSPEDLVLGGQVEATFGQKKLLFDADKGTFGLAHSPTQYITLEGEGLRATWTEKALIRRGLGVKAQQALKVVVKEAPPYWQLAGPTGEIACETVEHLLEEIAKQYPGR